MEYEYEVVDVSPPWSGLGLAVLARGVEIRTGTPLVYEQSPLLRAQERPLIGPGGLWSAEVYVDTGSRSARGLRGVEEGFVLKTSVLLRYWNGRELEERILYPYNTSAPSFLLLRGDDRKRQASLYTAELAVAYSLLSGQARLPADVGIPRLVVRHGSLLQSLGTYFNPVFDLDRKTAEALLLYTGIDKLEAQELVEQAVIRRGLAEKVNPGLLAALILGRIKRIVEQGGGTILGLTEDVSRGRHLIASLLVGVLRESVIEGRVFRPELLIDEVATSMGEGLSCLEDLYPSGIDDFSRDISDYFLAIARTIVKTRGGQAGSRYEVGRVLAGLDEQALTSMVYESQALNMVNLSSDSHFLLLYNYLFGSPPGQPSSVELDKSRLYTPRIRKSYSERIEAGEPVVDWKDIGESISGVMLRYVFTERVPSCLELEEKAGRLGIDRRLLAEIIRVVPPLRIEYFSNDRNWKEAARHVLTQALVTHYGVPPQLLVVDARSRVNEWEYSALTSMLEELSRRTMPYSTFIRDFSVRVQYMG
ncbi:MAG: hypothetical protein LRS48_00575 [Desulfurococcales archaeon]|nr:hypothetical protein [Desulfurococcales archaeon]